MKCVVSKHPSMNVVKRVSDREAAELVAFGNWHYTTKSVWKAAGRVRNEVAAVKERPAT